MGSMNGGVHGDWNVQRHQGAPESLRLTRYQKSVVFLSMAPASSDFQMLSYAIVLSSSMLVFGFSVFGEFAWKSSGRWLVGIPVYPCPLMITERSHVTPS